MTASASISCSTQGVDISVKIETRGLHDPTSLAGIRHLIEIELKNGGFSESVLRGA